MAAGQPKRIVMAVNNPATMDNRVVKSAQMAASSGFECHVVGILQPGYDRAELRDGVAYHRAELRFGLVSLVLGYAPTLARWLPPARDLSTASTRASTAAVQTSGETGRENAGDPPPRSSPYPVVLLRNVMRRILKRSLRLAGLNLSPAQSAVGVRILMGSYLRALYPVLVALEADVYHAHELWTLECCALAARRSRRPLVYDSHELEAHRNNTWSEVSNRARMSYEQRYIGSADLVMSVSEGCCRTIEEIYSLEQVSLLRNMPLLTSQARAQTELRREIGIGADVPLLVYTGSVTINRGLDMVLTALQHLTEFHLVTVGPWNENEKAILLEYAREIGVDERFHMHPKVPAEELIDLISGADLAVIPIQDACLSYRYCLPNKLFEAAFSGLPVVASNLPDMSRFISENELGATFESDNPESLTAAIREVFRRRNEYVSAAKTAAIRKRYCFEKEAAVFLDAYRQLLAQDRLARSKPLPGKV